MRASTSLQKELLVGLTLGMVLLWLAATLISGSIVRQKLDNAFDNAMQETAQRLLPLAVVDILNREGPVTPQRIAPLSTQRQGFSYVVRDQQGNVLLQSSGVNTGLFEAQHRQGFSSTSTHRLYGASALRDTLFLQIAEPLSHRRKAALDATIFLLLPLLILIPLSVLGIWLFVRFSLRGVLSYRQAIETRGVGNLSPIRSERLPTELAPVAEAVNRLIERLQNALQTERRFTANSAHELRTPIATTLAQVQRLCREAPDGPLLVRATQVEASLQELSRLTEKLLQLAKAEGGGLLSEIPEDLALILAYVVEDLQRTSQVPIELSVPATGPVWSFVDADAFAILVRNLLENAVKHGSHDTAVEVSLSNAARLSVVNGGEPVSNAKLAKLSQRFVRGDSRAEGFGLGLAIATMIAQGVDAELTLNSPASGRADGFEVIVQFSAASAAT